MNACLDHRQEDTAMNEQEWVNCSVPQEMLTWLAQGWRRRFSRWCGLPLSAATRRKLCLFAGACCVRSTQGITIPHWDNELRILVSFGKGEIEVEEIESFLVGDRKAW